MGKAERGGREGRVRGGEGEREEEEGRISHRTVGVRPTLMNFQPLSASWYFRYTLRSNSDRVRSESDGMVGTDLCVHP